MESEAEHDARIEGYVEAIEYFIDHPEAPLGPVLRAYVDSIKRRVDEILAEEEPGKAI